MRVNVFGTEVQRGWSMADSAKALSIECNIEPEEPCPLGGFLPTRGGWLHCSWGRPRLRGYTKVVDGVVTEEVGNQAVEIPKFTGQYGVLYGMTIITDSFREPVLQSKYYFIPKHTPRGIEVYIFERAKENEYFIFKYRSAREARVDMKRCRIPEQQYYRALRK
jgi:hypothetical protein